MKNKTGIVRQGAVALVALCDFTVPSLGANPTEADYTNAMNAIETGVATSTNALSFQKWISLMIGEVTLAEEDGDVRSVKLATGEEYYKTTKVKGSVVMDVKNASDPYLQQILTGVKMLKTNDNKFYRNQKFINKPKLSLVVKILTQADENGKVDIYYYLPGTVSGSLLKKFKDYGESDYEGSELRFDLLSGANSFEVITSFDPTQNENSATV